jgi:transcriptional regulator with XRE-family HTH domain
MKFNEKDFVPAKKRIHLTPNERLRHLRELQELSQIELAEMTGISQSNISAMETGQRNIGRERAIVLAKALQVHPALILFSEFDNSKYVS